MTWQELIIHGVVWFVLFLILAGGYKGKPGEEPFVVLIGQMVFAAVVTAVLSVIYYST